MCYVCIVNIKGMYIKNHAHTLHYIFLQATFIYFLFFTLYIKMVRARFIDKMIYYELTLFGLSGKMCKTHQKRLYSKKGSLP